LPHELFSCPYRSKITITQEMADDFMGFSDAELVIFAKGIISKSKYGNFNGYYEHPIFINYERK
jgi:hypothetical protein